MSTIEDTFENLETRIFDSQRAHLTKEYSEDVAADANYGWGVNQDEDGISYSTKFTTSDNCTMILTTNATLGQIDFDHEEADYDY